MARMSSNAESSGRDFGDCSQPNNWILGSGVTCHIKPEISDFIPGSLVDTDKYIKVADGKFVTAKQTGEVQIKMRGDNGKPFIYMLYNVLLSPDLCDQLFPLLNL